MAEPRILKLQSPAYGEPIFYKWPLANTKKHDEATEITDTIRLVCEDFPELKYAVENSILQDYEPTDYDSMNQLCQRYNKAIRNILSLWKGRAPPPRMFKPPNKELLRHIINLCYSNGIKEPEKLNLYEPFSPEVYGETSFDMVAQILEECQSSSSSEEIFIDLGSGVGQVVLQAAASNQFKDCFGVEKAETPAMYAKEMEREFRKWMDWFGKIYTDFTLEKGDFLEEKWTDTISNSKTVFVNNFAFGPVVNHHLKQKFQQMKEGAKIISSREFCPLNFKFNKRNLSELGAMMRVTEMKPKSEEQTVSWTGNIVSYYLHVVDRTRLEKYFSILKKRKEGTELDEDELSLYSESNVSVDTTGTSKHEESLEENLDGLYLGTTTRHQWQVLNDTIQQSRKDAKSEKKKKKAATNQKQKKNTVNSLKSGNLQLKDKILQKYGYQKAKKSLLKSENFLSANKNGKNETSTVTSHSSSSTEDSNYGEDDNNNIKLLKKKKKSSKGETKAKKTKSKGQVDKEKQSLSLGKGEGPSKEFFDSLDQDIDRFYDSMKAKAKEFIKRMNTKEYAERLKVMIECEQTKKKLLQREVSETEQTVQQLINSGLTSFSNRLVELDLAVKTPLELLSTSTHLAEKRQELENKVTNMEVEVYSLEEKYKTMCTARNEKNQSLGLEPIEDQLGLELLPREGMDNHKNELTSKLCGSIVAALNHRRSLLDQQSSLSEQISILEKISSPTGLAKPPEAIENEAVTAEEENKQKDRPKPRPVAFVPPRMLSDDKKSTVSPETPNPNDPAAAGTRRPRGRPRKHPKANNEIDEKSQDPQKSDDSNSVFETEQISRSESALDSGLSTVTSTSSHQYDMYQAREERAPIVFPTKLLDSKVIDEDATKEFLRASSKLLSSAKNKWRPLEELDSKAMMEMARSRDQEDVTPLNQKFGRKADPLTSPVYENPSHLFNVSNEVSSNNRGVAKISHPAPPPDIKPPERPTYNIYDNVQLTYSQQYEILNRSLATSIAASLSGKNEIAIPPVQAKSNNSFLIPAGNPTLANASRFLADRTMPVINHALVSRLESQGIINAGPPPDIPVVGGKKKNNCSAASAKGKRSRKRKSDEGRVIIPGNHVQPDNRKAPEIHHHHQRDIEAHFQSSLGKYYQSPPKYKSDSRATPKQIQSVITANPVSLPHSPHPSGHPSSIVVPPVIPSYLQLSSIHHHSNLDILKQVAVGALPERTRGLHQTLTPELKQFSLIPLVPSPNVTTSEKRGAPTTGTCRNTRADQDAQRLSVSRPTPHTNVYSNPMEAIQASNSLYAFHNRLLEQNAMQPISTSILPSAYLPGLVTSNYNIPPPPEQLPARSDIYPSAGLHLSAARLPDRLPIQPKPKKPKREKKKPSVPVILAPAQHHVAAYPPTLTTTHGGILRSMLLSTGPTIAAASPALHPKTLLMVTSNSAPQLHQTKAGYRQLLAAAPTGFPVVPVQTFGGRPPLVILPVPSSAAGKNPHSSPTFPPPKAS